MADNGKWRVTVKYGRAGTKTLRLSATTRDQARALAKKQERIPFVHSAKVSKAA